MKDFFEGLLVIGGIAVVGFVAMMFTWPFWLAVIAITLMVKL